MKLQRSATAEQRAHARKVKMARKAGRRQEFYLSSLLRKAPIIPAGINRHTGEPHKHERQIARAARQRQSGEG